VDIIGYIKQSGAYNNPFFRHCRDSNRRVTIRNDLIPFAKNWHVVTRTFWHASCGLIGVLGARGDDELLPAILKIAAEDGGLSGGAVNGIFGPPHHKLFQQMFWEREVVWFEEPYHKAPLEEETDRLISTFSGVHARTLLSRTLGNDPLVGGLATVIVVETIALEIIKAMEGLFRDFDLEKCDYLRLHRSPLGERRITTGRREIREIEKYRRPSFIFAYIQIAQTFHICLGRKI